LAVAALLAVDDLYNVRPGAVSGLRSADPLGHHRLAAASAAELDLGSLADGDLIAGRRRDTDRDRPTCRTWRSLKLACTEPRWTRDAGACARNGVVSVIAHDLR